MKQTRLFRFSSLGVLGLMTTLSLAIAPPGHQPAQAQTFGEDCYFGLPFSYSFGSEGTEVRQIQRALGIFDDGIYGTVTENAVLNFQIREGLFPDGITGPRTLEALGLFNLINPCNVSGDRPGGGLPSSVERPYVVVVPGDEQARVQAALRGETARNRVCAASSGLGRYTRVGPYSERYDADRITSILRDSDIDARTEYQVGSACAFYPATFNF